MHACMCMHACKETCVWDMKWIRPSSTIRPTLEKFPFYPPPSPQLPTNSALLFAVLFFIFNVRKFSHAARGLSLALCAALPAARG